MPRKKPLAAAVIAGAAAALASPAIINAGPKRSSKTVTVISKLPMSIEIQLCGEQTARVTGQFGSTQETIFVKSGPIFVIRGCGYPAGQAPKGFPRRPQMVGSPDDEQGFALTPNVDADFFAKWLEQNGSTEMVRNGLIAAHDDLSHLEGHARERADIRSGLEPVNPEGDDRAPQPLNKAVQEIKTEPRANAA